MPAFLLDKKNEVKVLVVFFVLLLGIFPSFFIYYYWDYNQFDENGMLLTNRKIFYDFMNESMTLK